MILMTNRMQLRCLKNQKHARQCNPIVKDYLDAKSYDEMQELYARIMKT